MSHHMQQHVITIAAGAIEPLRGLSADWVSPYKVPGEGLFWAINDETRLVWCAQGLTYARGNAAPIETVYLKNTTAAAVTAKILSGKGAFIDSRGPFFAGETQAKPSGFAEAAHVSVTATSTVLLAAANTSRVALILSNLEANGSPIYYGGAGIGAGEGAELPVGASVSLPTTAEVRAYNPSASACLVGISEVTD